MLLITKTLQHAICISSVLRHCGTTVVSTMSLTALSDHRSQQQAEFSEVDVDRQPIGNAPQNSEDDIEIPVAKKAKLSEADDDESANQRKKKVAMLLVYSGKGYLGMQRNPGFKTIESDLLDALVKSSVVRPDHIEQPGVKMAFQRAARTDKGVSAAGQVVSLKMLVGNGQVIDAINSNLPEQIRVLGVKRTTKGFDSKNTCDSRTYSYIMPTFAFAPVNELVTEDYRITDDIRQQVGELLDLFRGTHNFHNFTSGKKPTDPSAKRYIMYFTIGEPFIRNGIEFVKLNVRGQSFMLHQIRKMIGLTIAIMRGMADISSIERSWGADKTDVPKAPGVGLVLDQLHYEAYNRRFGRDGVHEKIDWDEYRDQIDSFVDQHILPTIYKAEKEDKSMIKWLATLPLHHYGSTLQEGVYESSPLVQAHNLVQQAQAAVALAAVVGSTQSAGCDEQLTASCKEDTATETSDAAPAGDGANAVVAAASVTVEDGNS